MSDIKYGEYNGNQTLELYSVEGDSRPALTLGAKKAKTILDNMTSVEAVAELGEPQESLTLGLDPYQFILTQRQCQLVIEYAEEIELFADAPARPEPAQQVAEDTGRVTNVKIRKHESGSLRAFVTAEINGITINGLKIMDGKNGLFVSLPSTEKNGKYYPVIYITDKGLYAEVQQVILSAYEVA